MTRLSTLLASACLIPFASSAEAYPSSVVFAPTADVRGAGSVSIYAYNSVILHQSPPTSATMLPWAGVEAGLAPVLPYGAGLGFGGVEIGADVFPSYGDAKPVLNVKIEPLKGDGWVPSLAIGFMSFAPGFKGGSLNLFFGATTLVPPLDIDLGRFTLGYGYARPSEPGLIVGTWPFAASSHSVLIAGYESPPWRHFYLAVDHVSGATEIGSTNAAIGVLPVPHVVLMLGATFAPLRTSPYDGIFCVLAVDFSIFGEETAEAI